MSGFEALDEQRVVDGPVVSVYQSRFRAPDGTEVERQVIRHPGATSVVPIAADGERAILVRQFRAAINQDLLEIPAGKLDEPGEPPAEAAQRELAEEIGMRAGRLDLLAEFVNSPGFCDERSWVYLGTALEAVPHTPQGIEEEHLSIEEIRLADVATMIRDRVLTDAKTIIGLLLARDRLGASG